MAPIGAYHRPEAVEMALELLSRSDVATVALGGGTVLNGLPDETPDEVVDLQALGLSGITRNGGVLQMGAMATLRDLIDHEWTPPLLRDLARAEAPNTIRNAATVGGTVVAADSESGLVAGLLAYSATVLVARLSGSEEVGLGDLLTDAQMLSGGLVTSVRVAMAGEGVFEATARTPADTPIVLVAGHRSEEGSLRLAATGVDSRPVLIEPDGIGDLDPPSDFRGSPEYRRHLAGVLAARVMSRLDEGGRA